MSFFSIIVPNYNHAAFLQQRIGSILEQTYPHYEIIILDDASTDRSREIIEQYRDHPKVKSILYNETNTGLQTRQWLKGIEQATYDWIWIAESDDIAEPGFLETAARALSQQNSPLVFYTDSWHLKEMTGSANPEKSSMVKENFFKTGHWLADYIEDGKQETDRYMKFVCTINNVSACVIPKKEALDVLYHCPPLHFYNDWFFYIQMLERCDVVYSSACLNWYRIHMNSYFNRKGNELTKRKECYRILCYLYKAPYITDKNKLVKFVTEQYLAFGLWKERRLIFPLLSFFIRKNFVVFMKFLVHFISIKITRKKIKYIF